MKQLPSILRFVCIITKNPFQRFLYSTCQQTGHVDPDSFATGNDATFWMHEFCPACCLLNCAEKSISHNSPAEPGPDFARKAVSSGSSLIFKALCNVSLPIHTWCNHMWRTLVALQFWRRCRHSLHWFDSVWQQVTIVQLMNDPFLSWSSLMLSSGAWRGGWALSSDPKSLLLQVCYHAKKWKWQKERSLWREHEVSLAASRWTYKKECYRGQQPFLVYQSCRLWLAGLSVCVRDSKSAALVP